MAVARLEPAMTNESKDRHVLPAAVASEADAIGTFNLRDFPADACDPDDVEVLHPDRFLVELYDLDRAGRPPLVAALRGQPVRDQPDLVVPRGQIAELPAPQLLQLAKVVVRTHEGNGRRYQHLQPRYRAIEPPRMIELKVDDTKRSIMMTTNAET